MRYLSPLSLAACLVCCLATSPARAGLATPDPGASEAPAGDVSDALQGMTRMVDEASRDQGSPTYASDTKSGGPSSGPSTSQGVDRTAGAPPARALLTAGRFGSSWYFARGESSVSGESAPASPPAGLLQGEGAHAVAAAAVPGTDLTSLTDTSNTPLLAPLEAIPTTPIPSTVLLLSGGLLALFLLRRSISVSQEVCREAAR